MKCFKLSIPCNKKLFYSLIDMIWFEQSIQQYYISVAGNQVGFTWK